MHQPNILLVVLDSVSAARLSTYGYHRETTPNIDAFADNAITFDSYYANSSWTIPTHGTMFTGLYPSEHHAGATQKEFVVPREQTLAGRLTDAGYHTAGFSANPWVSSEFGFDTGFNDFHGIDTMQSLLKQGVNPVNREIWKSERNTDELIRTVDWLASGNPAKRVLELSYYWIDHKSTEKFNVQKQGWCTYLKALRWMTNKNSIGRLFQLFGRKFGRSETLYPSAELLNRFVDRWLKNNITESQPFFMFLNYMDAHEPYKPSQEHWSLFRDEPCTVDINWHLRSLDQKYENADVECINDYYDACLHYLDTQIGELLTLLENHGICDETLVVLTADHGKCLGEHDYMGVGTYLYDELLHVPLFVRPPRGEMTRISPVSDLASQVDLHEAILHSAGVETDGENLLNDENDFNREYIFAETLGPHQDVDYEPLPTEGLRRIDCREGSLLRNIESGNGEIMRDDRRSTEDESDLSTRLESYEQEALSHLRPIEIQTGDGNMSDKTREQLKGLGYL